MNRDEKDKALKKPKEFISALKRGEEFTRELLRENEHLRFRVAELEEARLQDSNVERMRNLEDRVKVLESELTSLKRRFRKVVADNRDYARRYLLMEEENNHLANLYVASYQIHSTLDHDEVLKIVVEILLNMLGAEKFAVMLLDKGRGSLSAVASEGMAEEELLAIPSAGGIIGEVALRGESYFSDNPARRESFDPGSPVVCVALKVEGNVIGVIAVYSFFVQKSRFTEIDYELFNLLSAHAATAMFTSRILTRSDGDLATIHGFLELLKKETCP